MGGEHTVALGTLDTADATRLFADRARAARRDFALDDTTDPVVAAIVTRLDERFRLLTGSGRARGRHQTLRAALSWSTDLLEPGELSACARLSVFAGSFDLGAAEAVVGDDDAWERLDALVDKSLVLTEDTSGALRFRMLEIVREFATKILLLMDGAAPEARTRHAHHYLALAESAGASPSLEVVHDALARDHANFTAAFAWFAAEQDVDGALRLVTAFDTGGLEMTARGIWDHALTIPGALEHPLGPRVLAFVANREIAHGGSPVHAYEQARTSIELAHELGIDVDFFHQMSVGATFMRSGHLDAARESATRAAALAADHPAHLARASVLLTAIERWSGDLTAAAAAARTAEAAARSANQPIDVGQALMIRGYVELVDDPGAALPPLDEAITIALDHLPAARTLAGFALGLAGRARARLGDGPGAAEALRQAIALTADEGSREEYGTALGSVGAALLLLEQSEPAATILAAAEHVLVPEYLYLSLGVEPAQIDERLRDRLGADAHATARARGAAMAEDEVEALALAALASVD